MTARCRFTPRHRPAPGRSNRIICTLIPFLSGCVATGVVEDAETRSPIENATVYHHTSSGTIFARNQHYQALRTGSTGAYRFPFSWRRDEETSAIFPGYYPNTAARGGVIRLTPIPDQPLPILQGHMKISATGIATGFRFATGTLAPLSEADIAPVAPSSEDEHISSLRVLGRGAAWPFPSASRLNSTERWCLFFNTLTPPDDPAEDQERVDESLLFVRCRDGEHYAKLWVTSKTRHPDGTREIDFRYAYQPAGTPSVPAAFTPEFFDRKCLYQGPRSWIKE